MRWMPVVLVVAVGCGTTTEVPAADVGPDATDAGHADAGCHCDDGMFCNGVEHCGASGCVAGTAPCMASETCDEANDRCINQCSLLPDADHDGVNAIACGGTDCDDANNTVHPGAMEVCDPSNLDEDCNPMTFGTLDMDGDGDIAAHCCNGTMCGTDCDDAHADVHPGAAETCNQRDDDCDAAIDEGLTALAYYPDCDGDAFGDAMAAPVAACATPTMAPPCAAGGGNWVTIAGDCDETNPSRHAGAPELCNNMDDDCNGTIDDATATTAACRAAAIPTLNTTVSCVSGVCTLGACPTLMGDCNGLFGDGCELVLSTSPAHCGMCTRTCGVVSTCTAGACSPLVDIDAGGAHTCALYQNGHAICWGANNEGQLGDGTRVNRTLPVPVSPPAGLQVQYQSLDAGGYRLESDIGVTDHGHTCGTDGTNVYCWGRNTEGQLGTGGTTLSTIPIATSVLPVSDSRDTRFGIVEVGAGGNASMACEREFHQMGPPINTDWAWGASGAGAIGSVPTQISAGWCAGLAVGYDQACLMNDVGQVYCLGGNAYGQLGVGGGPSTTLVQSTLPSGFLADQIAAGGIYGSHLPPGMVLPPSALTCARAGGRVYCFGDDTYGQHGDGAATNGVVQGLTDATDIAVGGRHACAVRATGNVVCWGSNQQGQLGTSGGGMSTTPVTVPGITTATAIAAGGYHSCALLANGTAMCWGANDVGQLGNGTTNGSSAPGLVHGT